MQLIELDLAWTALQYNIQLTIQQDTCSNEHEVCPMPLHKYKA